MKRPSWQEYCSNLVQQVALRSTCRRLAVGALIVKNNVIIGTGYNGSLPGDEHCIDPGVGCLIGAHGGCIRTQHAERSALAQCTRLGIATQDAEIYVTHFPCLDCTKQIIHSGIKRVYYMQDYKNDPYAEQLLSVHEIECIKIKEGAEDERCVNG
ncbi:deoxycytidylate deaminase (plasmid) [Paenibacillus sp. EC2-1]|uniref:deoxycytidylate deaminase n=1 Tax=Paenibacillus sp. EC2-1 TaxID=3388665 RepID=UPI003BEED66B